MLAEGPTYPGAVPVVRGRGADVHHVAVDAEGDPIDLLADAVDRLAAEGRPPKFLYVIPTFQNPAGVDHVGGAPAGARARSRRSATC